MALPEVQASVVGVGESVGADVAVGVDVANS